MALTLANLSYSVAGNKRRTTGRITFDSSYPTGGESLTPGQLGMFSIDYLSAEPIESSTPAIREVVYEVANNRLVAFTEAFAEVANATDLSTFSCRFEAIGY